MDYPYQKHISSYKDGLNSDTSPDSLPPSFYVEALDIRITTAFGESNAAVVNIKGNVLTHTLTNAGEVVIGTTVIRDDIFIFTTANKTATGGQGYIYKIDYDKETDTSTISLLYDHADFGFTMLHPIEAYGIYETEEIKRIYWVDHYENFRSINIEDAFIGQSPLYNNIEPKDLDVFPNVVFYNPTINNVTTGGQLTSGVNQYAYKLTTFDGKETIISPPSNPVHIVEDLESESNTEDYLGTVQGIVTSKAVEIKIENIDTDVFEFITLIALIREDFEGVPEIVQVETKKITDTEILFVHSGNEAGSFTLTISEYVSTSYPFKTAKTINSKDSLLVLANTKSENFSVDLDMSTKRYLISSTDTYADEYLNPYNNLAASTDDLESANQYKYQSNSDILGGTGTYVDYKFTLEPYIIDSNASNATIMNAANPATTSIESLNDGYDDINNSFDNMSSPQMSGQYRGYKRGETYRFAIVFVNSKGSPSFANWIGDIKFPEISDVNGEVLTTIVTDDILTFPTVKSIGEISYGFSLGIQFNVHNLPTAVTDVIEGWYIVRVEREFNDMTRIAQGVIQKYHVPTAISGDDYAVSYINGQNMDVSGLNAPEWSHDTVKTYRASTNILTGYNSAGYDAEDVSFGRAQIVSLFSPEISYNFNRPPINSQDGLRLTGYFTVGPTPISEALGGTIQTGQTKWAGSEALSGTAFPNINSQETIEESKLALPSFDVLEIDSTRVKNYCHRYNGGGGISDIDKICHQGTNLLCALDANTGFGLVNTGASSMVLPSDESASTLIVDYVRFLTEQYGGTGEAAVSNNVYRAASRFLPKSLAGSYVRVYGGDIFVGMVDILRGFNDGSRANRDLDLDGSANGISEGARLNIIYPVETTINVNLIHGLGVYRNGSGPVDEFDIRESNSVSNGTGDYYLYNDVFSNENDVRQYLAKPINFDENVTNDYRAHYSNPKINGELQDSWSKFGINNFFDVDSKYGEINKLLNLRDQLYYLQDNGFGSYSINPRAVINTSDGIPTQLGTGQGFVDYNYISTENGCIHQFGNYATQDSIYYLDAINKKIMWFTPGQGAQPMTDIKGLHGFLNKNLIGGILRKRKDGGDTPAINLGATMGYDPINKQVLLTVLGNVPLRTYLAAASYTVGEYIKNGNNFYIVNTAFTNQDPAVVIGSNPNITLLSSGNYSTFNQGFTLSFSELLRVYDSKYSFKPHIYIQGEGLFMTPNPISGSGIYTHDKGDFGKFYGASPTECNITLCINPNADINKVLRFIEFNSTIRDTDGTIDDTTTITAFRIRSSDQQGQYQDSGKILFTSGRIKRRFRKWRIKLPRDINSTNQQGRFRDTWFFLTLYYDNLSNKEIVLNRIVSHFNFQQY